GARTPGGDAARSRASGWPAGLGLLVAAAAGVGLAGACVAGAGTPWLGAALGLALAGLGFALAYWGRDLVGGQSGSEPYPLPPADAEGRRELGDELGRTLEVFTRRRLLSLSLLGAAGAVAAGALVFVGSLGPRPRRQLFETAWTEGARLVTFDGRPVTREMLAGGGYVIAFPEGHEGSADSQVAVLRVPEDRLVVATGRETWSPEGIIAYSRICTHAGCPVAQYQDEDFSLVCPCHQSRFDVLDGGRPTFGPAGRPLPQLPLRIEGDGTLVAQGDFAEPVGPGFWNAP
ncbi:MAG TPA: Rieske (2Fe-2S) protein, partial [Thermoleophilia bacterium]|nr:Rieske (2Fe-2S) protein [Thermoleophilia bacterium]